MASYARDILNAVARVVAGIPGLPPVKIRKRPVFRDRDPEQLVVVSPLGDDVIEDLFQGDDGRRLMVLGYRVLVTILTQGNLRYDGDAAELVEWRERIRQTLYVPELPGVASVYDCDLTLGELFDMASMDAAYDRSSLTFRYHSKEPANG